MTISRRHFLISACAGGLLGSAGFSLTNGNRSRSFQWRGSALGSEARITLFETERETAEAALTAAINEIERLEAIFSLNQQTSELTRLNTAGKLVAPSWDLVHVLRAALQWRKKTEGAFDPTVQPLWRMAKSNHDPSSMLPHVGVHVAVTPTQISLPKSAALTLNGIAQGTIADRVTDVLQWHGFDDVVIDAGELRLPGCTPRNVSLPACRSVVTIADMAVATSEPGALIFKDDGAEVPESNHLFDPRTGRSAQDWKSVTVFAPTAEMADTLSTAFAVCPPEAVGDLASTIHDVAAIAVDRLQGVWRFGDVDLAKYLRPA